MARYFLFGLLLWPLVEIAVLIKVGGLIGVLPTLLLIVGTAIVGGLVIRHLGLQLFTQMRATMGRGQLPAKSVADAMLILFAGFLLLLPGFVTDVLGLLLLLPPVRELLYGALKTRMTVVTTTTSYGPGPSPDQGPRTIELDDDDYHRLR